MSFPPVKNIPQEQPPEDPTYFNEWVARQMFLINGAFDSSGVWDLAGQLPYNVTNGLTKYFATEIPDSDILYPGPYMWIEGNWVSMNKRKTITHTGSQDGDQVPLGVDIPMQIAFGPAAESSDGAIELDADGTLRWLRKCEIDVTLVVHYTRTGSNLECYMVFSSTFNDVYSDNSIIRNIARDDEPEGFEITYPLSGIAGDEVKIFMTRDSQGTDDGYLHTFIPTLPELPPGYGATLRISRLL